MSRKLRLPSSTDWLSSPAAKDLVREALEAPSERRTQAARVLRLLIQARNSDVPLPVIMRCAAQYNNRIHHLRRAGFRIVNRSETQGGVIHSWYRLEIDLPEDSLPAPHPRAPRERKPAENMQLFADPQEPARKQPKPQPVWRDPEMGGTARG